MASRRRGRRVFRPDGPHDQFLAERRTVDGHAGRRDHVLRGPRRGLRAGVHAGIGPESPADVRPGRELVEILHDVRTARRIRAVLRVWRLKNFKICFTDLKI